MPKKNIIVDAAVYVIGPSIAYIKLSKGYFACVDIDDAPAFSQMSWTAYEANKGHGNLVYANTNIDGRPTGMHVLLMGKREGFCLDHKNRNSLDNRRANLRFATRSQNMMNRRRPVGCISKAKNVYRLTDRKTKAFVVDVASIGKRVRIHGFDTEAEASIVAERVRRELHGEFACDD